MKGTKQKIALNRPVFLQRAFDSSELTVLTTLFHRFAEPGQYDVSIYCLGRQVRRFPVMVAAEHSNHQFNLDMAKIETDDQHCKCGSARVGYTLAEGGMIGFYASRGTGRYSVSVVHVDNRKKEKKTLLDSTQTVAMGDYFAVTLVRPGVYHISDKANGGESKIRVTLPKVEAGKPHRTDEAALAVIDKSGKMKNVPDQLLAGRSVVFQCDKPSRILVELIQEDPVTKQTFTDTRRTFQKPKHRSDR